jgi:hypothetical protein
MSTTRKTTTRFMRDPGFLLLRDRATALYARLKVDLASASPAWAQDQALREAAGDACEALERFLEGCHRLEVGSGESEEAS